MSEYSPPAQRKTSINLFSNQLNSPFFLNAAFRNRSLLILSFPEAIEEMFHQSFSKKLAIASLSTRKRGILMKIVFEMESRVWEKHTANKLLPHRILA
jgi:hypothetical protein